MILIFTDPYQFHKQVHYKMQWIYSKILFQYEEMIRVGRVPDVPEDERKFIQNILMDQIAWSKIFDKKESLERAVVSLIEEEYPEDVFSVFITSFDNSILFQYGMDRNEIELYLNNIG
ncbi:MAG: hypothetical protein ACTSQQ_09035, partial [Candidatus Helarchaeota archaeon]